LVTDRTLVPVSRRNHSRSYIRANSSAPKAPLKELLVPYQPSDYRSIVVGDWESTEGRVAATGEAN